jgi:cytoskeletal protein RodZ
MAIQSEQVFSSDTHHPEQHRVHRRTRRKSRRHKRKKLKKVVVALALITLAFLIMAAVAYFIVQWTSHPSPPQVGAAYKDSVRSLLCSLGRTIL